MRHPLQGCLYVFQPYVIILEDAIEIWVETGHRELAQGFASTRIALLTDEVIKTCCYLETVDMLIELIKGILVLVVVLLGHHPINIEGYLVENAILIAIDVSKSTMQEQQGTAV